MQRVHSLATIIFMGTQTKFGEQPAKARLRAAGTSVARAALAIGVPQSHLTGALCGHIRPNQDVRDRLPGLLNAPIEDLFTTKVLAEAPGSGRGGVRKFRVSVQRAGNDIDGVHPVVGIKEMERPPVRGESVTFSDGEWIVNESWFEDGAFTINLRRPEDGERTWPKGTFHEE